MCFLGQMISLLQFFLRYANYKDRSNEIFWLKNHISSINVWKVLKNGSNEIRSNEIRSNEIRIRQVFPVLKKKIKFG